jgi:hypothetical protein
MTAFKELPIGTFVLRFYKTDHVWTCTVTENMLDEVSKELALQRLSDIGQEIENEQVGWLGYHEGHLVSFLQTQEQIESFLENTNTAGRVLPVYTHPMRELTNDEIMEICDEVGRDLTRWGYFQIEFARAILKKASEK